MQEQVTQFLSRLSTPALVALLGLAVLQLALQVWAIVDLIRRSSVRFNRKWVWLLLIVCGGLLGTMVYFGLGRIPYDPFEAPSPESVPRRDHLEAGVSRLYRDQDRQ